jgi:hypothetical protein
MMAKAITSFSTDTCYDQVSAVIAGSTVNLLIRYLTRLNASRTKSCAAQANTGSVPR